MTAWDAVAADTDVVLGARQFLAAQPDLTALLGSGQDFDTWLFTDKLYVEVLGSQTCAVVLTQDGTWTSPNAHNTARFPRLTTTIYADPRRDATGNITKDDTRTKLIAVGKVLDRYLHRPDMAAVMWGSVRTLASQRLNELLPRPWADGDHAASAQLMYAVGIG